MVKALPAGEKVEISNFIIWFCLKAKFPEQKIWTAVSCSDSERLWKLSAKAELWFQIQPTKNFFPKLSMAFQCNKMKILPQFLAEPMYIPCRKTAPIKSEISTLWLAATKFTEIFLGSIGNLLSLFPKTFHGLSVSQDETPATVFGSTNLAFRKNHPIKFEILTLWLTGTKFTDFFLGWIGNLQSLSPQTFHGLSMS